ncbi:MAG: RNA polymerase factor sigma-54 [Alphaproteobacteria bacterium]
MALSQRLDVRQTQSLVMTPQLQQAIKLLQMSNLDLQDYVLTELESNPLLERAETDDAPIAEIVPTEPETLTSAAENAPAEIDPFKNEAPLDTDFDNVWASEHGDRQHGHGAGDHEFSFEQTIPADVSLREHLLGQVHCDLCDPVEKIIGAALVEMLDESGYLPRELDLVRAQLGAPPEQFAAVIAKLQRFDPPGIFARDLKECLALQLRDRNRFDPAMAALIDNLDLIPAREFQKLQSLCGVDAEDLAAMLVEVKTLNPRPAQAFAPSDVTQTLIPDVLLRPLPGGGWQVELNPESLPRVLANESYYTRVSGAARAKADKDYLSERWQQANWLVKALHQRATTILKVAAEIIRHQDQFFVYGVARLRPLTLRQIAEAVSMHESTISRVTANKYIATPRGIFELKYFFSGALGNHDGGEAHAASAVRHKIKTLIEAEGPSAILADDRIAALLQGEGIDIARRTVAKYRESMNIPSSAARRRHQAEKSQMQLNH